MYLFFTGYLYERGIQQFVSGGGRIGQGKRCLVGVDAVLHGEVHQHGAGERT